VEVAAFVQIPRARVAVWGPIPGDCGHLDGRRVRYTRRGVARRRLPGLYAASAVALVTPLRDGMNLVAKEYVAAQDPADPGVLVLSRFAGAAEQMADALLVNPYDTAGTADVIQQALRMPLEERRARQVKLIASVRAEDVHWWAREFLTALQAEGI
jgi:trehalose 6-phosphate synthase